MIKRDQILRDPEFYFIVFYNAIILYLYVFSQYDPRLILWGYYLQSVFIGIQYVSLSLTKIYKEDRTFLPLSKLGLIGFFIMHFGIFHLVYFVFLTVMTVSKGNTEGLLSLYNFIELSIGYLIANSIFLVGREWMPSAPDYPKPSILLAYARIIPIHLFIVLNSFSGISSKAFLIFMGLKLVIDLLMYIVLSNLNSYKEIK